jgi:hypothetical protein
VFWRQYLEDFGVSTDFWQLMVCKQTNNVAGLGFPQRSKLEQLEGRFWRHGGEIVS